ncbi:MAG: SDR family NAD(P)-dependent oxidoreductase, partial [Calditrichae bacterium]|nr:SDR family NAD(P)-dependent oxidoreductase [Calditrichia bacterium]
QLNVTSLTALTRLVLEQMRQRGEGKILNVSSTAAFQPGPSMAVYYATKAYVLSFSEALANELRGTGITVSTLCPGPTKTEFQRRAGFENVLLMKSRVMSAERVARIGYRGLQKGKKLIIPGLLNKLMVQAAVRLGPRKLVASFVHFVQKNRTK